MEILTVPAHHVANLLKLAEKSGVSRRELLASCNLSEALLEVQTAPIPFTSFITFANNVMLAMEDESCGMFPKPIKPGSFALLCQSCIDCKTLGHFLRRRIKFFSLISDDVNISLRQDEGRAIYEITASENCAPLSQHIIVIVLALAYKMGSWSIRERIPLASVSVFGDRSKRAKDYDNLFDLTIDYGNVSNQMCFPASYLDRPILQDAASMEEFLQAPAYYLMAEQGVKQSLAYETRKLLQSTAVGNFPSFDTAADHFNLSVATLRRRLQDENTSYQQIKDEVRRDFAITVLAKEGNVKAAAFAAGFSEPASFFRAFKRWTGTTPKAYLS